MIRTYAIWKTEVLSALTEKYGKVCENQVKMSTCPSRWWKKEILPFLESGQELPKSVCRSIVKNGGGFSLPQIAKHYPGSVPVGLDIKTGKIIPKTWN